MAKSPALVSREARNAPPGFRSRATRNGSSGWLAFVSRYTKAVTRITARTAQRLGSGPPAFSGSGDEALAVLLGSTISHF